MDIDELFDTIVRSIYQQYNNMESEAYALYNIGKLSNKQYTTQKYIFSTIRKMRIIDLWKTLSYSDQISFYIKSSAQETLLPHLTEEQLSAIIIIQDKAIVHYE